MTWVQIHVRPTEILVGFTYEDESAGLSAKGAIVQPESLNEDVRRAIERPDVTVRLDPPGYQVTPLAPETIARLGLPAVPPWLKFFGMPPQRPWRSDTALTGRFHPEYPDHLEVAFFFRDGTERMWVRTTDVEPTIGGYVGELLNAPFADATGLTQGDRVTYRVASGALDPIWVSPAVRANLAEWSSSCSACGFDMLLEPAEDILARQFEGSESLLAFTTRCPMCGQTMISNRRG